jgi:hypothetical protein
MRLFNLFTINETYSLVIRYVISRLAPYNYETIKNNKTGNEP